MTRELFSLIVLFLVALGVVVYYLLHDKPLSPEKRKKYLKESEEYADSRNTYKSGFSESDGGFSREEIEYDYLQRQQEQQEEEEYYLNRMNDD